MALPVSRMDGVTTTLHFDDAERTFSLNRVQDVEGILDLNKAQQANEEGMSQTREMRHVARIPVVVYHQWCEQYGFDVMKDKALLRRLLNDPDNRWLRVDGGRV
jgi:hypothetical protein